MPDSPEAPQGLPLVDELRPAPDPEKVFLRLAGLPHCLFLDSARRDALLGRYSFIAADPFAFLESPVGSTESLARLSGAMQGYSSATVQGLPPFQGGAAGMFSYELGRELERLPAPAFDEFRAPALAVGLYDLVVAFDHMADRAWVISQGFPETEPTRRRRRAVERLRQAKRWLSAEPGATVAEQIPERTVAASELAPQFQTPNARGVTSNFSSTGYLAAVRRAIDYVHAGDVFQVNLAQRLICPARGSTIELYLRLRRRNAATFAAWFDAGGFQIASASPERFLQVRDRRVEARPIKGTRRRAAQPEADLFTGDELRESEKDRAENVMIVDLLRNDLSRVCRPESIEVPQLCRVEMYEFVQHLVSAVRGELRDECGPLDLLHGAFPGGSVTGAPKVRAMEIIAELEPTARGPYCGALGYLGFDGSLDTSILIRTITSGRGWWQFPVGGGIVSQSSPEREYEETWHKAEGLLRALD
jgi:para-aminobenzoate synthetase component I